MCKVTLIVIAMLLGLVVVSDGPVLTAFIRTQAQATMRQLELFGIPLKRAARSTLRQALSQAGAQPKRVEDGYWVDLYNPQGILDEATELAVGYVGASSEFAFARYTFQSSMDTDLVRRIIKLVSTKYGAPAKQSGNYGLGDVQATWHFADGMRIEVTRGWPDTTTTLMYLDSKAYNQMEAEINAQKEETHQGRARIQRKAF